MADESTAYGAMERAVRADVARMDEQDQRGSVAASALLLARLLDTPGAVPPDRVAPVVRELRATREEIRALAPPESKGDRLDELAARRNAPKQLGA